MKKVCDMHPIYSNCRLLSRQGDPETGRGGQSHAALFKKGPAAGEDRVCPPPPASLQSILDLLVPLMDPDKVFFLGAREPATGGLKPLYDLLIAIPGKHARPHRDYAIMIEHISLRIHPVTAIILDSNSLCKMLSAGHIYYSRVCRAGNLLFDAGRYMLPHPETIPVDEIRARAVHAFDHRLQNAGAFLDCSRYLLAEGQKGLAAFMLHQCIEQVYRGMLQSLMAKEMMTHDLHLLIGHCRRCAPELCPVFLSGNEADERRLRKLKKAYVNARYKDDYMICEEDLTILMNKCRLLQVMARDIFRIRIREAAEALGQARPIGYLTEGGSIPR